jgi:hypothetical protein
MDGTNNYYFYNMGPAITSYASRTYICKAFHQSETCAAATCSTNQYVKYSGSCETCHTGRYMADSSHSSTSCTACGIGKYKPMFYETSQGTYDSTIDTWEKCNEAAALASRTMNPTLTYKADANPKGCFKAGNEYYFNNNGKENSCIHSTNICVKAHDVCLDCPVHSYQNQQGQVSCTTCASGQYQDQTGQSTCKNCGQGHYSYGGNACTSCPAHSYQNEQGQPDCKSCPLGKIFMLPSLTGQISGTNSCNKDCSTGYVETDQGVPDTTMTYESCKHAASGNSKGFATTIYGLDPNNAGQQSNPKGCFKAGNAYYYNYGGSNTCKVGTHICVKRSTTC